MNRTKTYRLSIAFVLLLSGTTAWSQDEAATDQSPPQLKSLESGWWSYFETSSDEAKARAAAFLSEKNTAIASLQLANQGPARTILASIRDNFDAYLGLLDDPDVAQQQLPESQLNYSLDEWLALAEESRRVSAVAAEAELEVEREQRILDGASRRRDLAFKNYVAAELGDERIITALRLVQNRSAQAIAERRLELLGERYQRSQSFADTLATRVEYATERLASTATSEDLAALSESIDAQAAVVSADAEQLRTASLGTAAIDIDSDMGRSQQHLAQQKQIDAQVKLALSEVKLAKLNARRWWTELQLRNTADLSLLEEQALQWSELVRRIDEAVPPWRDDTQSELLAAETVSQDDLSRAQRRLLDQRSGTAQVTLSRVQALESEVAELQLISAAVDDTVSEYSGAVRSWFSRLGRDAKVMLRRASEVAGVRLFSIGEAPVTGADIVRFLIIMIIAFLLSRGIRHAIARVTRTESAGTQASLYTVGRLTHYAIITIALFIALSTIGLNFSSLALVAGALGVGIGFGLQSIVSNFVSGLIILFEHTLRVGDYVELDTGLTGTVKAINVRSTLINTNDNIDIVVPNSEFVTTRLTNWTLGERILRVRIPFGVAYGSDKEQVRTAAIEAANEVSYTLTHMRGREPDVWLVNFGDSSLDFLLLVWVNRQGASRPTRTRAAYLWALETKLTEYGIEIPFPQRDLNLRNGWRAEDKQAAVETFEDAADFDDDKSDVDRKK